MKNQILIFLAVLASMLLLAGCTSQQPQAPSSSNTGANAQAGANQPSSPAQSADAAPYVTGPSNPPSNASMLNYNDPTGAFSISYPGYWKYDNVPANKGPAGGFVHLEPPGFGMNGELPDEIPLVLYPTSPDVSVYYDSSSTNESLDEISLVNKDAQGTQGTIIGQGQMKVGGQPGYYVVQFFTSRNYPSLQFKLLYAWTVFGNHQYTVYYYAPATFYDAYYPLAVRTIDSLQLHSPNSSG